MGACELDSGNPFQPLQRRRVELEQEQGRRRSRDAMGDLARLKVVRPVGRSTFTQASVVQNQQLRAANPLDAGPTHGCAYDMRVIAILLPARAPI